MDSLMTTLQDPDVRAWYVAIGMTLIIAPMLLLAFWYHRAIRRSPGGRELMRRQHARPVRARGSLLQAHAQLREGIDIARDVSRGRYGDYARGVQNKVYWLTGVWATALVAYFGLLLWADEAVRTSAN